MRHQKSLWLVISTVLVVVLSAGCFTPVTAPTPQPAPPTPLLTLTPAVTVTALAVRDTRAPSPTPLSVISVVTTRTGETVEVTNLHITPGADPFLGLPVVPLESGLEVEFDYINRVEFGDESGEFGPVTITLVDGTVLRDNLGWKVRPDTSIAGETEQGAFNTELREIQLIVFQRESTASTVPQAPPTGSDLIARLDRHFYGSPLDRPRRWSDSIVTLVYTDGETLQISALHFHYWCTYISGGIRFCCGVGDWGYPRALEGMEIDLSEVKELEFTHEQVEDNRLPVRVTTLQGKVFEYHTQPPSPCEGVPWRVVGEAALGMVDTQLTGVRKIIFGTAGQ